MSCQLTGGVTEHLRSNPDWSISAMCQSLRGGFADTKGIGSAHDELMTYVRVGGKRKYLCHAFDKHSQLEHRT